MRRQDWLWLALFLAGAGALAAYLPSRFPDALGQGDAPRFAYLMLLLVLLGSSLLVRRRARPAAVLRGGAVWLAIALALLIGYSYRDALRDLPARLRGELVPQQGQAVGSDAVMFRARDDGHFQVEALVDDTPVVFLVDTGASDVVLSRADAQRLGFDPDGLAYTRRYETANGAVLGAPVRLRAVVIGPIHLADVAASVNQAPMDRSLLGMSFLRRLSGYTVRGDRLTLWR